MIKKNTLLNKSLNKKCIHNLIPISVVDDGYICNKCNKKYDETQALYFYKKTFPSDLSLLKAPPQLVEPKTNITNKEKYRQEYRKKYYQEHKEKMNKQIKAAKLRKIELEKE